MAVTTCLHSSHLEDKKGHTAVTLTYVCMLHASACQLRAYAQLGRLHTSQLTLVGLPMDCLPAAATACFCAAARAAAAAASASLPAFTSRSSCARAACLAVASSARLSRSSCQLSSRLLRADRHHEDGPLIL